LTDVLSIAELAAGGQRYYLDQAEARADHRERVASVVTPAIGPSDAAVRAATLLARPDGGHGDLLITRSAGDPAPDLRAVHRRIVRHGFEGHARSEIADLAAVVAKAS
jgi:hypothetical protein